MSSGETVAQLLVEIGADIQGLLDGMGSAKAAVDEFQSASASSADAQDVFGERVSARLAALSRDYQTLGQSEQEAAASAESARAAIEQSVASAAQRRVGSFAPAAAIEPLDAAVSGRLEQVAAQYRLLGQSAEQAAASAMALRPAIEQSVSDQARARIERLAPTLDEVGAHASPLTAIFNKVGAEMATIGRTALGFATGMLAANVAMGAAERFKDAAEQIDTFGTAVWKVQTVTGETAENASGLVAIFERFGLTGDEAASKLSRFERAVTGADTALDLSETGGKRGAQILHDIGVQSTDAAGRVLPLSEVLTNLASRWTQLDAESKNAAARGLFGGLGGQGAEQLNLMLSQGREGFEALMEAANKYGLVLSQGNVEDVKRFTFAHRDMDLALQGVAIQLGATLMPAVTNAAKLFTSVSQVLNQALVPAIKALPSAAGAVLSTFTSLNVASVALGLVMGPMLVSQLAAAAVGLGSIITGAVAAAESLVVAAASSVLATGRFVVLTASMIGNGLVGAFAAVRAGALLAGVEFVATAVKAGLLAVGQAALALANMVTSGSFLTLAGAAIASAAAAIGAWAAVAGPILLGAAAIAAVAFVVYEAWTNNWAGIRDFVSNVMNGIKSAIAGLLDWLAEHNLFGIQKNWRDQIASVGQGVGSAVDTVKKAFGGDVGTQLGTTFGQNIAGGMEQGLSASVKQATAAKDAAHAALQQIQDDQTQRKLDFDTGHVDMESDVLQSKLAETQANAQLLDYKRQLEDLDRSAIDYANQRLKLDEQDAVTRAQIAESAAKAQDEDLGYQQNLLKAELRASRHGGAPVDSTAIHTELRQLHDQQLRETPALLIAQHNVQLADRTKQSTDLQDQLQHSSLARAKIEIEEAMQPFVDAASAAKRVAEDAQRTLDLEKQKFAINEQSYQLALLQAQLEAKKADHDLYLAQHPDAKEASSTTVNVTVNNNGNTELDHMKIVDAVYYGITQAAKDAKSGPMAVAPRLGGARYATG